mgnify:CR=1 FL=1
MANDKKITELNVLTTPTSNDVIPIVSNGETKKITNSNYTKAVRNSNTPLTASGITVSGDIVPTTPRGATLGTLETPFREIYLQSGSISIESDTPGAPSALIKNVNGNLQISVGGMRLVEDGNSFIAETGSFQYISGSMTQVGDYTRNGDTFITGAMSITGSFEASLQENYVWLGDSNNRSTPTPLSSLAASGSFVKAAYGSFYSTQNQAGTANQIQVVTHNVTDFASGVTMVSGSQITFEEAGVYTLISTMQYQETGGGTATITGWLRKNGVDVADSATDLKLKGNGDRDLYAINYFVNVNAGDYVEFCWSSNDVDTEILYIAPRTLPTRPAVPSVITTVNRVG